MRVQVIVNPYAGGGKGGKFFPLLQDKFKTFGLAADCALSNNSPEALAIALTAREKGCRLLVVCGGDGTVHSILPALVNQSTVLGLLPLGTANDLSRNWGIPRDLNQAVDLLTKGHAQAVDVIATPSGEYIAGAGGVGFDAAVIERAHRYRKHGQGILPFLLAVFVEFFRYRPPLISITAPNWRYHGPAWQILFTNIPQYARYVKTSSVGKLDDGLMEILLVPGTAKLHLLALSPFFLARGFKGLPKAQSLSASEATLRSSFPLTVQGDGELIGQTPMAFRVLPQALRVMMPAFNPI